MDCVSSFPVGPVHFNKEHTQSKAWMHLARAITGVMKIYCFQSRLLGLRMASIVC